MINGKRRGCKGQILLLILIVLLSAVVVFALLSARSNRVRATPKVLEAYWKVGGQRVTSASVDDKVEAIVVIEASEHYIGSVVVRVRKDVSWWFDSDYAVATTPVDLRGGVKKELVLEFASDEASGGGLRGYFIEVEFSSTGTTWTMDAGYPPRLQVTK